jgi:hypothetical protein
MVDIVGSVDHGKNLTERDCLGQPCQTIASGRASRADD